MKIELYCPNCETSVASGETCPRDGTRLVNLAAQTDPLIGRELDNRFTIVEKLGQGGMGAVYRASQHSVNREVAIKVVHANLVSDSAVIKRFLREAKLASKLSHPNAVSVMDFGQTEDGLFYLVMELLEGHTLDVALERDGVFDARRLVHVGIQVCDALEAAHALSIIHRDLKPSNILLLDGKRDFVKVLDFGLAKSLENEHASQMTGSGNMIGTPAYMPPERACGESGDVRSDLYSLGCIMYLLGSGRLPFDAPAVQDLLLKQVLEPAPPMTGVPWAVAQVIDKLLQKDPNHRYQTAAETRAALETALETLPARSGSQPSIIIPTRISAPIATAHETMDSPVPGAEITPHRRRLKSTAIERLEQSDTLGASAALRPLREGKRPRGRIRWIAASMAMTAAAALTFMMVASNEGPASAAAATLPTPSEVTPVPSIEVTGKVEAAPSVERLTVPTPAIAPAPQAAARPVTKPTNRRTTTPKRGPGKLPF